MNASTAHRPANPLAVFLAGLQAGMIAICWMLAWLGLSAMGQRRSFWTAENLMATVFHGDAAIRRGFGSTTLSGLALYLLIYSLLGAVFAVDRSQPLHRPGHRPAGRALFGGLVLRCGFARSARA